MSEHVALSLLLPDGVVTWFVTGSRTIALSTTAGAGRCAEGVGLRAHPGGRLAGGGLAISHSTGPVGRRPYSTWRHWVARSSQDPESPERRYIEAVWVEPEFRRLGVGRRLVRWLIDHERKSGIKEILLWGH